MNETVGQLIAASYKYGPKCTMGVVIGYGLEIVLLDCYFGISLLIGRERFRSILKHLSIFL